MDALKLRAVVEANAEEQQRVYGTFDAARVPTLTIPTFENVADITLAVSPDCSYRMVRDALATASSTLDLYIYNISAAHLLDLLVEARDRGVALRVMYDAMDSRGDERAKLQELGVELKVAPSTGQRKVFTVCHQKFAVIDGRRLVLGSANWAGTSIPKAEIPGKFKKGNREWLVRIDDTAIAQWFASVFQADWDIPELEAPDGLAPAPAPAIPPDLETRQAAVTIPDEVFEVETPSLGTGARVTPIMSPDNYFATALRLINDAQTSIDIEQQYIVAGGPRTSALLEALAARKGEVEIRIIVSSVYPESWEKTVTTLTAVGLEDVLRAINLGSFTHLHNKGLLIDRKWTVVTSTNMSENSITQAREAGVLIESDAVGAYYGRAVDVDWASGIDPADVATHLAEEIGVLQRLDEPTQGLHPADVRMI